MRARHVALFAGVASQVEQQTWRCGHPIDQPWKFTRVRLLVRGKNAHTVGATRVLPGFIGTPTLRFGRSGWKDVQLPLTGAYRSDTIAAQEVERIMWGLLARAHHARKV